MTETAHYEAILLAAGQGKRMKINQNKVLHNLAGQPVILYSLRVFLNDPACRHLIIVAQADEQQLLAKLIEKEIKNSTCKISIISGGDERQDSVYNGLKAMENDRNIIMVHDGARPFVRLSQLKLLHAKVRETRAAILGVPVKDTIKKVENDIVQETVPRDNLWQIQTPQAFYGWELLTAHENAQKAGYLGTDDASLIEKYLNDCKVSMVVGSYENIKLTTPEDLLLSEAIIKRKRNRVTE